MLALQLLGQLLQTVRSPRDQHEIEAAFGQLLGEGKVGAASDLLLDHIARGSTDRDAQRLTQGPPLAR